MLPLSLHELAADAGLAVHNLRVTDWITQQPFENLRFERVAVRLHADRVMHVTPVKNPGYN